LVTAQSIKDQVNAGDFDSAGSGFFNLVDKVNTQHLDVYDIREKSSPDMSFLSDFFRQPETITKFMLNANIEFSSTDSYVYSALSADIMKTNCISKVTFLLESDIYVMIYNGNKDLIVQEDGTIAWVRDLDWSGKTEFN